MAEFDPYASSYDATINRALIGTGAKASYFQHYRAQYLCSRLTLREGSRILDYGCGTGNLSARLLAARPDLVIDGFDPSVKSISAVPNLLRDRGVFTNNPRELDGAYDYTIMAMVMHHIVPAERGDVLATIRELMTPAGQLAIFEHNPANPLTRRIVDRCSFDKDAVLVRPAEARDLVKNGGLSPIRQDYLGFFPPLLGRLDRFLARCPLGVQYVLVALRDDRVLYPSLVSGD